MAPVAADQTPSTIQTSSMIPIAPRVDLLILQQRLAATSGRGAVAGQHSQISPSNGDALNVIRNTSRFSGERVVLNLNELRDSA